MTRLLVVGDYAWDVIVRAGAPLRTGGDVLGMVELHPGGSAANSAVWASRCGAAVTFVGKIGSDSLAKLARDDMAAEGVEAVWSVSELKPTGTVAVWVDGDGERSMVSGVGADHELLPDDLPAGAIWEAGHLHLNAWSLFRDPPRAASVEAARRVRAAGGAVSLDPGSFQMIEQVGTQEFIELTTAMGVGLLMPNRQEASLLSGVDAGADPRRASERLAELYGGATVLLKLDALGCYVYEDGSGELIGTTERELIDATGAGDAFAGAYLAKRLGGAETAEAVRFANEVGGWVVGRAGSRPPADGELKAILG